MKITWRPHIRTLEEQLKFDALIEEMRAKRGAVRPKPVKPEGMTEEEFILSLQAPSTRRTLTMTPLEHAEYMARPLLTMDEVKAVKDADFSTPEGIKRGIGQRDLSLEEIHTFETMRRRPKNTTGQSDKSATTPEKKETASQAFIFSPPAKVTREEIRERAVNLKEYKTELKEVWIELPWWKALWHRIRGNKIQIDSKE